MTTYKSFFDLPYSKPWTWNADATVNIISGGPTGTVTGTQCPVIPSIDRGTNKFWNISYYDDTLDRFIVHETAYNTIPNERLLITVNNGISLFNIDPVSKKLPIRNIQKQTTFESYYNQNIKSLPFVESLNHKNGQFNYIYRTWNRLSLSNIGRDSERYTTEIFPKNSSFTATSTTRIVEISGGKYSISSRSEAYGGQFVGLNRGTASIGTADMSGEKYVNTIMSGLSQDFIDLSKFYKPTSINLWPSPTKPDFNTSFGISNQDYITFTYSSFFFSPKTNRVNGILRTKKGSPGTSSSPFAGLDYYIEFNEFSYLQRPKTLDANDTVACEASHAFNSVPISGAVVTLDGTTTSDRSGVQFLTNDIINNLIVCSNNNNNKYYYKDLTRNPNPTDYEIAGTQRNVNGRFYNSKVSTMQELVFISGGGCYNSVFTNSAFIYPAMQGSGGWNYSDLGLFESQYCDSSTNQWQRRDTRNLVVGAEKFTFDFWLTYDFEPSPPTIAIKFYTWTQNGSNFNYGYLTPSGSAIVLSPDLLTWTDEFGGEHKQAFYSVDVTSDYNSLLSTVNRKHNNIWIQLFGSANNTANFIPIRHPVPYLAYLDNEQKLVRGYTLSNNRLESLGAYNFHFTPTINDPTFSGNINDSGGLSITLVNATQPAYLGSSGYYAFAAKPFVNTLVLLDSDTGEIYSSYWSEINIFQELGYIVSAVSAGTQTTTVYNKTSKSRKNLKLVQKLYVDVDNMFSGQSSEMTRFYFTKEYVTTDGGSNWTALPFFNAHA